MNGTGLTLGLPQLNPQLLQATLLVTAVLNDVRTVAPQVLTEGSALVSQARIQQWQTGLQTALRLIRELPVPLIFPPPAFAIFAGNAGDQIELALATLAAIPGAAPTTFPPQFGQAILSREALQSLLNTLQQAQSLLVRALLSV